MLSAEHRAFLEASAIHEAIIEQRGYATITDANELLELGYADWQARLVPGLYIPMYDVHGEQVSSQFRPDTPRLKDEKPIKYETPQGAFNTLDLHPSSVAYLANPAQALLITEGVKKADAARSAGQVALAISGVYGWKGRRYDGSTG